MFGGTDVFVMLIVYFIADENLIVMSQEDVSSLRMEVHKILFVQITVTPHKVQTA